MSDKSAAIETALVEMVREFKGAEFKAPKGAVGGMSLVEDFGLDSLDLINLLFQVEQKYGVQVSAEDLKDRKLLAVGAMAALIASRSK